MAREYATIRGQDGETRRDYAPGAFKGLLHTVSNQHRPMWQYGPPGWYCVICRLPEVAAGAMRMPERPDPIPPVRRPPDVSREIPKRAVVPTTRELALAIRLAYPSANSERGVAVARGVIDPHIQPPDPSAGQRFDGEVHLSDKAVYFLYGVGTLPQPRVVRLPKDDLRDWKHAERDGAVGIEFATDLRRVTAMLFRSSDSDPDALIEFGRRIEDQDLLIDGLLVQTVLTDWEHRHTSTDGDYQHAAATMIARVRDAEPGVFIDLAELIAAAGGDMQFLATGNEDASDILVDRLVEESGYVAARARVSAT